MGFGGAQQGVDLMQAPPFPGDWVERLEDAGVFTDSCDQINWAHLVMECIAEGNARTEALSRQAVVFCEPEWGWDITGVGNGNYVGAHNVGGGTYGNIAGGLTVAW